MPDPQTDISDPTLFLHREELSISRRRVPGDTVRVRTITHERQELVDEELTHERVEIERVKIGRVVDAVPPMREVGDVTIIPVMEEVVVVERRLVLKEEIHMRRLRVVEHHQEKVILLEQDIEISRVNNNI